MSPLMPSLALLVAVLCWPTAHAAPRTPTDDQEVIERLRFYSELGVDEFSFWIDNSMPHEEKRKSLELFIKEVVPAFS